MFIRTWTHHYAEAILGESTETIKVKPAAEIKKKMTALANEC